MKKKFYYNGKLMRTSAHDYTHAWINGKGQCMGCRTSYSACESLINTELNRTRKWIKNRERKLEAIKNGKAYYTYEYKGYSCKEPIRPTDTIEQAQADVEEAKEELRKHIAEWKIVELEVR